MSDAPRRPVAPPAEPAAPIRNSDEARDCTCGHRHWFALGTGQPMNCTNPACQCRCYTAASGAPAAPEPPRCPTCGHDTSEDGPTPFGRGNRVCPMCYHVIPVGAVPPIPGEGGATTVAVSEHEQNREEKTANG